MIDGGRAYTVKHALEFLQRVEDVDLYWFEEPLEPAAASSALPWCSKKSAMSLIIATR